MPEKPLKYKPLGYDILIHPLDQPSLSESGKLYIPDTAKKRVNQGIVIAKGPKVSIEVDIADHVVFNAYSGDKIAGTHSSEVYVVPETHIVAVIQNSSVVMFDSETVKRMFDELCGEMMQKHSGNREYTKLVVEAFRELHGRLETFSRSEAFEF